MKSPETKITSTTSREPAKDSRPFFAKAGEGEFLGDIPTTPESFFQPAVETGAPNDPYEQEADAKAHHVEADRTSEPHNNATIPVQTQAKAAEEIQQKEEEEITAPEDELQMKPVFDTGATPPEDEIQRQYAQEDTVQQKPADGGESAVGAPDLSNQIDQSKGSGDPLAGDTRGSMESAFGADFGDVRIHTGKDAVQMNQQLNAQAFAHGADIYFNEGKYNTTDSSGRELLAHELTHTVQQGASPQQSSIQRLPESHTGASGGRVMEGGWIVDDHQAPETWQLHRTEFLRRLNEHLCSVIDEALANSQFTALGCPLLRQVFTALANQNAAQLERNIRRFDPTAGNEVDADSLILLIGNRARQIAATWLQTGEVTGLPPELTAQLPANWRAMARMAATSGNMLGNLSDLPGNLLSGLSGLFFKALPGGAVQTRSPEAVMTSLGSGQSMESGSRSRMEGAFGTNFSDVQVHTDSQAVQLNREMNSRAFTVGNHVAFGAGEYQPGSLVGDALMAHELAHVEQQRGGSEIMRKEGSDYNSLEVNADAIASGVMKNAYSNDFGLTKLSDTVRSDKTGLRLQRCGQEPVEPTGTVHGTAPNSTTETFESGNVPGERPIVTLQGHSDVFRFDGDGDQMKELQANIQVIESRTDGSARVVQFEVTMIETGEVRRTIFTLPNNEGFSGSMHVIIQNVTDGYNPSIISLIIPIGSQQINFFPPNENAGSSDANITYRLELASHPPIVEPSELPATMSQPTSFTFRRGAIPTRSVFQPDQPKQIGGIWALDITVGAYGDRFRMTFQKSNPSERTVVGGISVLSEETPIAGDILNLNVDNELQVRILATSNVHLTLDLNNDGQPDLEVYDRMLEPQSYDRGGPPVRNRNHDLLFMGPALIGQHNFSYFIRDGLISAGSTRPAASNMPAASNASAFTGLNQQTQIGAPGLTSHQDIGSLQGELDSVENLLTRARGTAHEDHIISDNLFNAWDVAERDFIQLYPQIEVMSVQPALQAQTTAHILNFYSVFAAEAISADMHGGGNGGYHHRNEYTGLDASMHAPSQPGQIIAEALGAGRWAEATSKYRQLVHGLDRWIANLYHERYGPQDSNRPITRRSNEITYLTNMRERLYELKAQNAVRVSAVFHPEEQYLESGQITTVQLSLYYVRENDTWYLHDRTKPDEEWHTSGLDIQPGAAMPPRALFERLDEGTHLPRGIVHYQVPNGVSGQVRTTGPHRIREWLTWIGLGAAAIGLGLVTFGTGAVAVVGTYALAASAIAGGALATADLFERGTHGTLTAGTAVLDLAQIIASIAGIGAIGAGRLVFSARTAAANSLPRTGTRWAFLLSWADQARVPLALTSAGADVVQIALLLPDMARQYDAIDHAPGDNESRRRAKMILLMQGSVTLGLVALSLRGNTAEITAGRSLEVVNVNGEPVVVPKGSSAMGEQFNQRRMSLTNGDEATVTAAEQAHINRIRSQIEGPGGQSLSEIEEIALHQSRNLPDASLTLNQTGTLLRNGQPSNRSLEQLIERIAMANNASRAHGIHTEYTLEIRQGTAPDISEVKIVSATRTPGVGVNTAGLYRNVPGRAQAEMANLQRLLSMDRASVVAVTSDGHIRINRQLTISPNRLGQIPDGDLLELMQLTRQIQPGTSRASINPRLTALGGRYYLRFEYQQTEVDALIQSLGVGDHPLFQNMTDAERNRLHQAVVNDSGPNTQLRDGTGQRSDLPSQATSWALSRTPGTVFEFANLYQYYIAQFKRLRAIRIARRDARIQELLDQRIRENPALSSNSTEWARERQRIITLVHSEPGMGSDVVMSGDLLVELGTTGNPRTAGGQAEQLIGQSYDQGLQTWQGRTGVVHLALGPNETLSTLQQAEIVRRIQRLSNEISFENAHTATYHTRKHFPDIENAPAEIIHRPDGQINETDSYLNSARESIRNPMQPPEVIGLASTFSQYGDSRGYVFSRQLGNGNIFKAIVRVSNNGEVHLITYF